jgi:hypothetical protein
VFHENKEKYVKQMIFIAVLSFSSILIYIHAVFLTKYQSVNVNVFSNHFSNILDTRVSDLCAYTFFLTNFVDTSYDTYLQTVTEKIVFYVTQFKLWYRTGQVQAILIIIMEVFKSINYKLSAPSDTM